MQSQYSAQHRRHRCRRQCPAAAGMQGMQFQRPNLCVVVRVAVTTPAVGSGTATVGCSGAGIGITGDGTTSGTRTSAAAGTGSTASPLRRDAISAFHTFLAATRSSSLIVLWILMSSQRNRQSSPQYYLASQA